MHIPWVDFARKGDAKGHLVALEELRQIPFELKRIYYIFGTQLGVTRGLHAHRELRQLAVCVSGSVTMLLDDGVERTTLVLDRPDRGVLIEPMIWHEMSDFSEQAVLLVAAEDYYDEADYIRSYAEFRQLCEIRGERSCESDLYPSQL